MNIKDRLYIGVIISIVLVVLLFSVNLVTSNRVAEESKKNELTHHLHQAISELDMVTYEYLLHHEKRMEQQWNLKYNSTKEILEELEEFGDEPIKSMRTDYTDLSDLFSQVIVNYEKKQKLIKEGASREKIDATVLLEERLVTKLLIKSQSIVTDVSRLEEKSTIETKEFQELVDNLTLILIIIIAIVITTTSFLVARSISKPLDKLIKGVEIVGKGNLKYRIDIKGKDEIGNLAIGFNDMSRKLRKSYSSLEQKVKERTRELEEAKNKSEVLLASIGDGVFAINKEGNIIHFNRAAEELSDYKASEVLGKPYYDFLKFVKEKDRSENIGFIKKALKGEATDMFDKTVLIRKDKKELPVADRAAPIKDEKGKILGAIVVFRDATQERAIERIRAELISLTSHQLKTPLTSINGYLEMLKETKLGTGAKEYVGEIERVTQTMIKLIGDVLNISRIEQGKVEIKFEPIQFEEIIDSLIKDFLPFAKKRKVNIEFIKPPEPLLKINADPEYLREAIQNIISNAINYTKDKVTISLEKIDNNLRFSCIDNGIGIPKEEGSKIFNKFYRASNVVKTGIEGTGLGLGIAKAIIDQHHGRIWFESEEDKRTAFYITLPFI